MKISIRLTHDSDNDEPLAAPEATLDIEANNKFATIRISDSIREVRVSSKELLMVLSLLKMVLEGKYE